MKHTKKLTTKADRAGAWAVLLALLTPTTLAAQVQDRDDSLIHVVFEYLMTETDTPLPILRADPKPSDDRWDGTALMDSYGGFERYDARRLLLGVRENGIIENCSHLVGTKLISKQETIDDIRASSF